MVAEDVGGEAVAVPADFQLQEERFLDVGRADAGRVEGLEHFGGVLDGFEREAGKQRDVREAGGEEALVVEAADEVAQGFAQAGIAIGEVGLAQEMFRQRGFADQRIKKMLAAFGVLRG